MFPLGTALLIHFANAEQIGECASRTPRLASCHRAQSTMKARLKSRFTERRYYHSRQKYSLSFSCLPEKRTLKLLKFTNPHSESVISFARARARASKKSLHVDCLTSFSFLHTTNTARESWQKTYWSN